MPMPIPDDLSELVVGTSYSLTPAQQALAGRCFVGGNFVWQNSIIFVTASCVRKYREAVGFKHKYKRHYEITPLPLPG